MRRIFVGIAFAGALITAAPAMAQAPLFDVAAVQASCGASAGACLAAIQAAITALQALGLPADVLNTQLGVMAGIATDAATSAPPTLQAAYAGVLNEIADASSDPAQVESLAQVASQLDDGGTVDVEAVASAGSET